MPGVMLNSVAKSMSMKNFRDIGTKIAKLRKSWRMHVILKRSTWKLCLSIDLNNTTNLNKSKMTSMIKMKSKAFSQTTG